jgi:hypothetical protein
MAYNWLTLWCGTVRALAKFAVLCVVAALAYAIATFLSQHTDSRAGLRPAAAVIHALDERAAHAGPIVTARFWAGSPGALESRVAASQVHSPPLVQFVWQIVTPPQEQAPKPSPNPHAVANESPRVRSPELAGIREAQRLMHPSRREVAEVEQRLKDSLSRPLYAHFELFVYVSKAAHGPWAQRMYVFEKRRDGNLRPLYFWPVSTGLEHDEYDFTGERLSTHTPAGFYELDPHRFYMHHVSAEWREPMPYAMFLNWVTNGTPTGLAIHAAVGNEISKLGARASSGCIRLPPEAARTLFMLVRAHYRGLAPRFAIDPRTRTMSNDGVLLRNARGDVELARGYKVLVFIENYGGENFVAAMF